MKNVLIALVVCAQSLVVFAGESGGHGGSGKAHRDNTALFPPHVADKSLSTAPAQAKLTAPAFMAKVSTDTQKLEWSASPTADSYHLQVATDANFKWLLVDDHWVKSTNYELKGLEKGKHYYWRVAAVKSDNDSMSLKSNFVSSMFAAE